MTRFVMCLIVGMFMTALPQAVVCQEEEPVQDEVEYSYGTVVSVNQETRELVIKEYDEETDGERDAVYSIDQNVQLENVNTIGEIAAGADIDLEYKVDASGKKAATYIYIYEQVSE